MAERVTAIAQKAFARLHHENHTMYDDPKILGEHPYNVPGERIVTIDNVPPKASDDEYILDEITSETGKIAILASELQANGHVVGVVKSSYNKVRVIVGKHPHEVAGALGVTATIGAGIFFHHEFTRREKPQEQE